MNLSCTHTTTCIHYWHQNEKQTWNRALLFLSFDKWTVVPDFERKVSHINISSVAVGN